jgi:hypothetical protein
VAGTDREENAKTLKEKEEEQPGPSAAILGYA